MEHSPYIQHTLRHASSEPYEACDESIEHTVIPSGTSGLFVDDHSGRPLPLSNQRFFQLPSFTFRKSSPTNSVWMRGSNTYQDYPEKGCERQQSTWICRHCSYANGDFGKKICAVCGLDRVRFQKRHSTGTATTASARSLSDFGSSFHEPSLSDFGSSFHSRNLSDFNSSMHERPSTPPSPYRTEFESYSQDRLEGVEKPRSFHALNGVEWASLETGSSIPNYPSQDELHGSSSSSSSSLQPTLSHTTHSNCSNNKTTTTSQTQNAADYSPSERAELFLHGRVLTMSTSPSGRGNDIVGETLLSSSDVRNYTDTTHFPEQNFPSSRSHTFSRSPPSTLPSPAGNVGPERRYSLGQCSNIRSNTLGAFPSQTSRPTITTTSLSKAPYQDATASYRDAPLTVQEPTSMQARCVPLVRNNSPTAYVPRHLDDTSERTFSLPLEDVPLEEMPFERFVKDAIFKQRNKCCTKRRCLVGVALCTGICAILLIVFLVVVGNSSSSSNPQTPLPSSPPLPSEEAVSLQSSSMHTSSNNTLPTNSTLTSLRKNWSRLGKPIRSAGYGKHFVALNEDGSVMATLSSTRSVGQLVEVFSVPAVGDPDRVGGILFDEKGIFDMDLSSDGMEIVVSLGDGTVQVYGYHNESDSWEQMGQTIDSSVSGLPTENAAVCFTADGKSLVTTVVAAGSKALRFQVHTLRNGVWQRHGPAINRFGTYDYADVKLSADGSRLAVTYGKRNSTSQEEQGSVEVFSYNAEMNTWEHYGNLLHFGYSQMSIALSSDGQALAVSDCNSTKVLVVDDDQWTQVGSDLGHAHHTCIDGSGYRVAIVNDNAISVWRFESTDWKAEFMDIMQEGQGWEAFLACSSDGKRIAVTKSKNAAVQPDTQTGTTVIYQYVTKTQ